MTASSSSPRDPPRPSLNAEHVTALAGQIAELARAGLPLAPGLRAAAAELPSRKLAGVFRQLADRLDSGQPLERALATLAERFPPHLKGLILAGIRGGRLDDVLEQFIRLQRQSRTLRRQVWVTLAYPGVLLLLLAGTVLLFSTVVVADLVDLFEDFEMTLPLQSQMLYSLPRIGWLPPVVTVAALGAGLLLARLTIGAPIMSMLVGQTPLLGPLRRWSSLAEFCRLLALLVERQIPLPEAVDLVGQAVRDPSLAAGCRRMAVLLAAGRSFAECVRRISEFPPTLEPLIAWGESAPALAESLRTAGALYEERAKGQLRLIRLIVPPFTFLIVIATVAFLMSAALAPMIVLIETIM